MSLEAQKFTGGGAMVRAFGVGIVALVISVAGFAVDAKSGIFSYLTAFAYWAGISLVSLVLLMIFHAFRAKWMVVLRRPLEAMATTVPLFFVLSLPVLAKLGDIYSWVNAQASGLYDKKELEVLHNKAGYLNSTGFVVRTVIYFVIATLIAWRLWGLSVRQDQSGDPALTQKQRNLGTGALPLIALVITFAAFDWLMSLNPLWFSTIFGVYYFAGSMWSTLGILIIASTLARGPGMFGRFVTVEHTHNLGKLLLAFTCFWAYVAFSQMMLIWIANLPEEIPFFMVRMKGEWAVVSVALIIGHFVIPFALLLSRDLKRKPPQLSLVAGWALLMHLLDIFWLVMPSLDPEHVRANWLTLIFGWVGMGALGVGFALWKIRGHYTVPVKDPFLDTSLDYRQPV